MTPSLMPLPVAPNFELVKEIKTQFNGITLKKWQSRKTFLSLILADVDSPMTHGMFVVPTEITNDSGCPHTLEHLVFLGSKTYPYKGILDSLATRAFSQGTNAWTDQDNTTYTLETAGWQGFVDLLPVYIDHILYPTLTDTGYVTEVHHINGKGEDAGVVYSEMQGRQNGSWDLMSLASQRMMYPEGSGYRAETGGLMEALRVLNIDQIRKYHASYYVPQNLGLIITGKVNEEKVLEALQKIDESIAIKSGDIQTRWKRPFVESPPVPPLGGNKRAKIYFPEQDESVGEVSVSWLGPKSNDFLEMQAIDVMGEYLSETAAAVLQKELVEIDDPYCTDVDFYETTRTTNLLEVSFSSVPISKMDVVMDRFFEVLKKVVTSDGIDITRMTMLLKRDRRKMLNQAEGNPHKTFSHSLVSDVIYGSKDGSDLEESMTDLEQLDTLMKWTNEQWLDIIRKWYLDNPHGAVLAYPSSDLAKKLEQDEKKRVEEQQKQIGEEGLKKLQQKLDAAQEANDMEIPPSIIQRFPVPDIYTIEWINVVSGQNNPDAKHPVHNTEVQQHLDADSISLPYFVHYDSVKSAFTKVSLYISTTELASRLRPYMDMYLNAFFALPVTRGSGEKLSHEQVVDRLEDAFVSYSWTLGDNGSEEMVMLYIRAESERYADAIAWLRDLLVGSHFDVARLKIIVNKILNSLPEMKRSGERVMSSVRDSILYDENKSTSQAVDMLSQTSFLKGIAEQLDGDPATVVKDLEEIRQYLCRQDVTRIHIVSDVKCLQKPKSDIANNFIVPKRSAETLPPPSLRDILTDVARSPNNTGKIVRLPSIENSYSTHVCSGPTDFYDKDFAPLHVAIQMLTTVEGPFWKHIRGAGLAYGVFMSVHYTTGLISLTIYRAPDAHNAYAEARKVVQKLSSREVGTQ